MWARVLSCVSVCLLLPAVAPSPAAAEINVAESIDWMVRDADLVVRGVVVAVRKHTRPGKSVWYEATLRVAETIKGTKMRNVRFAVHRVWGGTPAQWKSQGTELLAFFVRKRRLGKPYRSASRAPFVLRSGLQELVVKLSGSKRSKVYTRGFAVLSKRVDILKAARRAAASTIGARRTFFNVDVPFRTAAFRALYGGSAVWMRVPVDVDLLRKARRWIRHPNIGLRVQGTRVLRRFRSPANVAELRRLLKDRTFYVQSAPTGSVGPKYRYYAVREAAFKILKRWNVRAKKPVTLEPIP